MPYEDSLGIFPITLVADIDDQGRCDWAWAEIFGVALPLSWPDRHRLMQLIDNAPPDLKGEADDNSSQ